MFFVKMMLNENLPDECNAKGFRLIQVKELQEVVFYSPPLLEGEETPRKQIQIFTPSGDTMSYYLTGNVYVMNEAGKTIAAYAIGGALSDPI